MAHRLDEPDQLAFVGGKLVVAHGEQATEEGQGAIRFMEHRIEPKAESVTINQEGLKSRS